MQAKCNYSLLPGIGAHRSPLIVVINLKSASVHVWTIGESNLLPCLQQTSGRTFWMSGRSRQYNSVVRISL